MSDIDQQELYEVVSSAVLHVEASVKLCYACHMYMHTLIHTQRRFQIPAISATPLASCV